MVFDPDGCTGRLRGCPFLGGWFSLLRGGFVWDAAMVSDAGAFLLSIGLQHHFQEKEMRFGTRRMLLRQIAISLKPKYNWIE